MILEEQRTKARKELAAKNKFRDPFMVEAFGIEEETDVMAQSRLKKALLEAGLS